MNKAKKYLVVAFTFAGMMAIVPAKAQFFGNDGTANAPAVRTSQPAVANNVPNRPAAGRGDATANPAPKNEMYYAQIGPVTLVSEDKDMDDEIIMLYMKNFNIYRSPSGQTRCDATFAVLTTLPGVLSSLSYRLKWQDMETSLSFADVTPGEENHYEYALLGNGCYNMDKQPNIIVNRCRAKGITQQNCAGKIRWITAAD